MSDLEAIVSTTWLQSKIVESAKNVRVLDVTWYGTRNAKEDYAKCHIPGAVYFDIMHGVENSDLYPRNIPDVEIFQKYVQNLGINNDTHVILCDGTEQGGFFIGGRAWWMFRLFGHKMVSVLNGGLKKWIQDGHPTTTEIPTFQQGNFKAMYNNNLRYEVDQMTSNLASAQFQVGDSRPSAVYAGTQDPKTGHYPGAKNIPFADKLLDKETNTFKNKEDLEKVLNECGLDLSKPLVTMCNSGMSSCSLALAAYVCGKKEVPVFHGGFSVWKNTAEPEHIEKGTYL